MSNNTSYKTIREISEKLLSSLASAGVVLTEGQKSDVDAFMLAIEAKIEEQKRAAIRATKIVVERRMDEEYKKVFESILKHQDVYNRLLEKIAVVESTKKISEEMADTVDKFIGEKLEECIPDEAIVDYHRLQNLEKTMASLKETLLLGDDQIQKAIAESEKRISESYKKKAAVLNRNLMSARKKLYKAVTESRQLKLKADREAGMRLLEEKTSDLPAFEANKIKEQLKGKSVEEIKAKFNSVYESVAEDAVKEAKQSLEEEINDIIAAGGADEKTAESKEICGKKPISERSEGDERDGNGKEDEPQKKESIDESVEAIDSGMMLEWMNASESINTRLF